MNQVQVLWSSLSGSAILTGHSSHSQKCWDQRISEITHSELAQKIQDIQNRARFLAVSAPHSGDWLNALPISACGLRLDDEAVRVAIGLRLGTSLCEPHTCVCGVEVNVTGTHGLACKRSAGRMGRHQFLNDIVWRAINRRTSQPSKSHRVYFDQMVNVQMVCRKYHGLMESV